MSGPPESSPGAVPGQPDPAAPPTGATSRTQPPMPGAGPWGRPFEPAAVDGGDRSWAAPSANGQPDVPMFGRRYPAGAASGVVPQRRPVLWPPARPEWLTALVTIAALVVVGAALAPLWVHLAPRLAFRVDQPGRALPVVPEAEEYIAADGRFVIITLVVGVLAGLGCWLVRGARGPLVLLALAIGGLLGAVVTWRLGLRIGTGYRPEDLQIVGKTIYQPLMLRARSALVVEPVAAVVCYLLAVGFSARNDLGRDELGRDDSGRDELGRDHLGRDHLGRDDLGRDDLGRDDLGRDDPEPVASTDAGPGQGVPAPDAPSSSSA